MESLRNLYVRGPGPSSSHTIGPYKAARDFVSSHPDFDSIVVDLYGSLAFTGKGHFTDEIILSALEGYEATVNFNLSLKDLPHPNTMKLTGYKKGKAVEEHYYFSLGGGKIAKDVPDAPCVEIYPHKSLVEIKNFMLDEGIDDLASYVDLYEGEGIDEYLNSIVEAMHKEIEDGLSVEGYLPGSLRLKRVAKSLYAEALQTDERERLNVLLIAFAYAAAENNASCGEVVTAPTCGSCGIIPSLIYYEEKFNVTPRKKIIDGLKVASLFGNLAKKNATISGAQGGCQAEIGVASSMGAALLSYIRGLSKRQIEYAAEVSLEHFLGLTCDPVDGYVQVPCIERNGIGALRSYNAYLFAKNIRPLKKSIVSYDNVLRTMMETGLDLNSNYKETSEGGLAKIIGKKNNGDVPL